MICNLVLNNLFCACIFKHFVFAIDLMVLLIYVDGEVRHYHKWSLEMRVSPVVN